MYSDIIICVFDVLINQLFYKSFFFVVIVFYGYKNKDVFRVIGFYVGMIGNDDFNNLLIMLGYQYKIVEGRFEFYSIFYCFLDIVIFIMFFLFYKEVDYLIFFYWVYI